MTMNCTRFRDNLDAYIDSELDRKTRRAMEEHANTCIECGELLNQAVATATMLAELNEGLVVPQETKDAWRKAVRAEANNKKRTRGTKRSAIHRGVVTRAVAGIAAALVVIFTVGTTLDTGLPIQSAANRVKTSETEWNYAAPAYMGGDSADGYLDFDYEDYGVPIASFEFAASEMATSGDYAAAGGGTVTLMSDGALSDSTTAASAKNDERSGDVVILRRATRSISTREFDEDSLYIDDMNAEYGAWFESRKVTGSQENQNRVMEATVRVPSDRLDDYLAAMDTRGSVTLREDFAEDVTSNYNDVNARLGVLRSQLDQLNAMNAQAESVYDLIEINERASEVTAEIEAYESRIRDWNSRRSYSSVKLTLRELKDDEPEPNEPEKTLGERMKEAFDASIQWLRDFGQNLAVFAASIAPKLIVWIPALIIVIVLLWFAFGRRRKKK